MWLEPREGVADGCTEPREGVAVASLELREEVTEVPTELREEVLSWSGTFDLSAASILLCWFVSRERSMGRMGGGWKLPVAIGDLKMSEV